MSKKKTGFRIEVFRTGTFKPMSGEPITYSAEDLEGIVAAYDPEAAPAPIVIGHPTTDAPAYGWVEGFEYDADADRLYADLGEVEPQFQELVNAGRFKKVSMSFHTPDASNNPAEGKWYPKHIGFLGAAAPAVSGLKPVELAASDEGEEVTYEAPFGEVAFGEAGFEDTASLFRGLRDWMIEKFGLEAADNVLPTYRIEWLGDREISPANPEPLFAAPVNPPKIEENKMARKPKKPVIENSDAEFAARETALNARETEIEAREAEARTAEHVSFAEGLVEEGKLLPVNQPKLVALLDALPADENVSFAEGSETPLAQGLMDFLSAQPKIVEFSETPNGEGDEVTGDPKQIAAFAAKYQQEQRAAGFEISISEAVEHVTKGADK